MFQIQRGISPQNPSIPLSFFGGIGGSSRIGVLVNGSNYLESLAHAEIVVFDKTGTLTKGSFAVTEIHPVDMEDSQLLELAAYAEDYSNHPISLSIKAAYGEKIDSSRISDVQEIAGHGVRAVIDGKQILAGNAKLMEKEYYPGFIPPHKNPPFLGDFTILARQSITLSAFQTC